MFYVLLIAAVVIIVPLAVTNVRLRNRVAELVGMFDRSNQDLTTARAGVDAATQQLTETERERDDAVDRAQRARRDAAEVANRLRDEANARQSAEAAAKAASTAGDQATAKVAAATAERDEAIHARDVALIERDDALAASARIPEIDAPEVAATAPATEGAAGFDVAVVWAMALARVERTWRVSVASGDSTPSPLESGDALLRTAFEIEVDAAREEAGADIDLAWTGPGMVETGAAVTALAVGSHLVAGLAKTAARAVITVTVSDDVVDIVATGTNDEGEPVTIVEPASVAGDGGHIQIPRTGV